MFDGRLVSWCGTWRACIDSKCAGKPVPAPSPGSAGGPFELLMCLPPSVVVAHNAPELLCDLAFEAAHG